MISHDRGLSGSPAGHCTAAGDERLLHRVLGVRELAVPAGDRAQGLRGELAQQALDVGRGHTSGSGAPSTWRTSICCWIGTPPGPGAAWTPTRWPIGAGRKD